MCQSLICTILVNGKAHPLPSKLCYKRTYVLQAHTLTSLLRNMRAVPLIRDLELSALRAQAVNLNILFQDRPFNLQRSVSLHLLHHVIETKSDSV